MSSTNLEIARRTVEAMNRGDDDALLATFAADAVFEPQRASMEGSYRGHDGIRAWLTDTRASFDEFRLDVTHRDLGDGRVLSLGSLHVRGQESGAETEVPSATIATVRDGRVTELKDYGEHRKALAAAGLSE